MVINGYPIDILVGGLTYPSELYEFVSWDDYSQFMEEKNPKPPTSVYIYIWYTLISDKWTYIDQENYQILVETNRPTPIWQGRPVFIYQMDSEEVIGDGFPLPNIHHLII